MPNVKEVFDQPYWLDIQQSVVLASDGHVYHVSTVALPRFGFEEGMAYAYGDLILRPSNNYETLVTYLGKGKDLFETATRTTNGDVVTDRINPLVATSEESAVKNHKRILEALMTGDSKNPIIRMTSKLLVWDHVD